MSKSSFFKSINWPVLLIVSIVSILLLWAGIERLNITTDIFDSLPRQNKVISDAGYILENHPSKNRILVSISTDRNDKYLLADIADFVTDKMKKSALFKKVGLDDFAGIYPLLLDHFVNNMPFLFSEEDLKRKISPLLTRENINKSFRENLIKLQAIESIGSTSSIVKDPLYFRNVFLQKVQSIFQFKNINLFQGHLLHSNGKHILIIAEQDSSSTDFEHSRKIVELFRQINVESGKKFSGKGEITIASSGVYRALYDNEGSIRNDIKMALILVSLGIVLLVMFSFRRPFLGICSLIPAVFGTMIAIFFYSIFMGKLSMVVLGFGGAIISITVDHGIAFLLFMDKPVPLSAKESSRNVKHIGLLAVLTSAGAFLSLLLSGFPLLQQIGLFTALGITSSFIFVHTIFPRIFTEIPVKNSDKKLFIFDLVKQFDSVGLKPILILSLMFIIALFNIKPDFSMSLSSLNSVSQDTLKAERIIKENWGDISDQVLVMISGRDAKEIQNKSDIFLKQVNGKVTSREISGGPALSKLFPGEQIASENLKAWKKFWSRDKIKSLKTNIASISPDYGFESSGFTEFFRTVETDKERDVLVSNELHEYLGIKKISDSNYVYVSTVVRGENFKNSTLNELLPQEAGFKIFDSRLFNHELGKELFHTFSSMFIIIGISVFILLLLFFADIRLAMISIVPVVFSIICTIGTLNILGIKIGIPGLMLAIVVIGMGIDYSIFIIRSHQRYPKGISETIDIVKVTVLLASFSTLIGFGALIFAQTNLLKNIGIVSFLGIGYSFLGAFVILPPILKRFFAPVSFEEKVLEVNSKEHINRVIARYSKLGAYIKFFARFKIKLDPMFPVLAEYIGKPGKIIDIGAGYGVPSAWILELYPESTVHAIEPDEERARITSIVFGERGKCTVGAAPDIQSLPGGADTALIMDMIHYLDDNRISETLLAVKEKLNKNGKLIMRVTVPSERKFPWERFIEEKRLKHNRYSSFFRTRDEIQSILTSCGFTVSKIENNSSSREETWVVAGL